MAARVLARVIPFALLVSRSHATPGAASFASLGGRPYKVAYDERALTINGERALFLSGSLHYPRGTPDDWNGWLDDAVSNGLNMVEIYVFWNLHMPTEHGAGVWSGGANFTDFIERCASRGLFVYLRVGPYVCAEWTYGGIPLWLAQKEGVRFRESNPVWQAAMEDFFQQVVQRTAAARQFAPQGGPVMLVQVENELQPTDRPYVDWCGKMAEEALRAVGAGSVPLTMCNGETAANSINTCNGEDCAPFADARGQSGRVLVDQPALWTENEGGFALWAGSAAGEPSYFWARSVSELARNSLRWFARGGSLINYYMFAGGSTRGLWAGAALTTAYAPDVPVCHDGLRHGAKFHFLQLMHAALASAAPELVRAPVPRAPTLLGRTDAVVAADELDARADAGGAHGAHGSAQLGFRYGAVAFVESNASVAVTVPLDALGCAGVNVTLGPRSAQLLALLPRARENEPPASSCGAVRALFRSDKLLDAAPRPPLHRALKPLPGGALRWEAWAEPLGRAGAHVDGAEPALAGRRPSRLLDIGSHGASVHAKTPIEQGLITRDRTAFASYARHGTRFAGGCAADGTARKGACVLEVDVGCAGALLVLVDGRPVGGAHELSHDPCTARLNVTLNASAIAPGERTLTIVSEHLGYANYGFRAPLAKGLVGRVALLDGGGGGAPRASELTAGAWTIRAGLDGERLRLMGTQGQAAVRWGSARAGVDGSPAGRVRALTWYRAHFATPAELLTAPTERAGARAARLHVNMSGFGRGHAWLNGHAVGRYWLLPRATGPQAGVRPTQALYHLPTAWLSRDASVPNVLAVLEGPGGEDVGRAALYVARHEAGPGPDFDERTWADELSDCEM